MSLADAIRKATAGIVPKVLREFAKSTVTSTRYASTRDAAGRPSRTPSHPVSGAAWYVREIADAHVLRVWGTASTATAEAQVPLTTDVRENDVVQITAGDLAGNVYEVQQLRRDYNGNKIAIALGPTGQLP